MAKTPQYPSERVATDLRRRIAAGEWEADEPLPTAKELAAAYGVSRGAIGRAIKILVDEGLVVSRPRWGVFVAGQGQD